VPVEAVSYCPQCLLVVFAAMGFYQYVMRDRILNGSPGEEDDSFDFDMDIEDMDESTQLMLLEMLTNDHITKTDDLVPISRDETRSA
jgi:hypothetical protein